MSPSEITFEIAKLILQLVGAFAIARLTVAWALSRYKSEKTWERQLTALVEAVSSLSEMRLLVGRWFDQAVTYSEPLEAEIERQRQRYQEAKRRLEDGIATAQLVLPGGIARRLSTLTKEMEATRHGHDYVGELDELYGVINRILEELIVEGRVILRTGAVAALEPVQPIP